MQLTLKNLLKFADYGFTSLLSLIHIELIVTHFEMYHKAIHRYKL